MNHRKLVAYRISGEVYKVTHVICPNLADVAQAEGLMTIVQDLPLEMHASEYLPTILCNKDGKLADDIGQLHRSGRSLQRQNIYLIPMQVRFRASKVLPEREQLHLLDAQIEIRMRTYTSEDMHTEQREQTEAEAIRCTTEEAGTHGMLHCGN